MDKILKLRAELGTGARLGGKWHSEKLKLGMCSCLEEAREPCSLLCFLPGCAGKSVFPLIDTSLRTGKHASLCHSTGLVEGPWFYPFAHLPET